MENLIETTETISPAESSANIDEIFTAKRQIEESIEDQRRVDMVNSYKEDRSIFDERKINLPSGNVQAFGSLNSIPSPPLMRATLYDQMFRKLFVQNSGLQKSSVITQNNNSSINPFVESVKDDVIIKGGFESWKAIRIRKHFTQGSVFTHLAFNKEGIVEPKILDYEYCFWDTNAERMHGEGGATEGIAQWAGVKSVMSRGAFNSYLIEKKREDLLGRVPGGDYIGTQDTQQDLEINLNDPVAVYTFYSIAKDEPFSVIFAGSNAVKIELNKGKDYEYKFRERPFIPIVLHSTDPADSPFYSQSYIGMLKDGAEALKKILNSYMISIPKSLNPWKLLVGDDSGKLQQEMRLQDALSASGGTPLLTSQDKDTTIQSLSPQSIYNEFVVARQTILDEKGAQMGLNFRIQEAKATQKASIFIEQQRDENEATQINKQINKRADEVLLEYAIHLTAKFGDTSGQLTINTSDEGSEEGLDGLGELDLNKKSIYKIVEGWDGYIEVDVTVERQLTTPQKIQARDNLSVSIQNTVGYLKNLGIQSASDAKIFIDNIYGKIMLMGLDNEISKGELIKQIDTLLSPPAPPQTPEGEDITEEVSEVSPPPQIQDESITAEQIEERLPNAISV